MTEHALDIAVVIVYLVGVAALGIALRGRQEGVGDYFLGSRRIAWPLILLSIVATETSSVTFLSVPGLAYAGDMRFLQLPIGYIVGRLGVAAFLMPHFFRGETLTLYETLGRRFGPAVQRVNSVLFMLTRTAADGLRLYLTARVVHELTGWSIETSIFVAGGATILYTFFGGIRAVIWTDFVQFFVYMLGAFVAGWLLIDKIPGGWTAFVDAGSAADKFRVFEWSFRWSDPYTFWAGLIGGAFLTAATHGADQMMVQRYLCTGSVQQARVALVSSGLVVLAQFAVFLLIGVGLFVFYMIFPPLEPFGPGDPDRVFVHFIVHHVPAGLRGLIVAAVFSAAMSTLSSSLNSVASAAVTDVYRPLARPGGSERHFLIVSRILVVAAGVLQMAVALCGRFLRNQSTVNNVLTVAAFTTGLTLGVLLLAVLLKPQVRPRHLLGGLRSEGRVLKVLIGLTGRSPVLIGMLTGAVTVLTVWLKGADWLGTAVAWPWFTLIGSGTTLIVGAAASYAIRPAGTEAAEVDASKGE